MNKFISVCMLFALMLCISLSACGGGGSSSSMAPVTYRISGKITVSGTGLSRVTVSLTGASTNSTTTDANGNYAFAGAQNGSYTITPSLTGYTFAPVSRSITVSSADLTGQDFTATLNNSNEVSVTGSFTGINAKSTWLKRIYAWFLPKAYAFNPSSVAKVLVFSAGDTSYTSANVINGTFSINVKRRSPAGMIFVDSNNTYLGYLTLKNGIDSLPMQMIQDNVASIDLGVLSSSGKIVEPSNNPIGNEIIMTVEEQKAFAQANGLFASIIQNPDVDNNDILDLLEEKYYTPWVFYGFSDTGRFGGNLTPTLNQDFGAQGVTIHLDILEPGVFDPNSPQPFYYGPNGSGYEDGAYNTNAPGYGDPHNYGSNYFVQIGWPGLQTSIPPPGQYSALVFGNRTMSFILPDQSEAINNMIIVVPTIELNANGTLNKISWSYRTKNSSTAVDPTAVIDFLQIEISGNDSNNPCGTSGIGWYTGGPISRDATEHILTCQDIPWQNVGAMGLLYADQFGNLNGFTYIP